MIPAPANDNITFADIVGLPAGWNKSAASFDRKFRIEASRTNPDTRTGYERDNINDYCLVRDIGLAFDQAVLYLENGYWVEVYDDTTDTCLAGPFSPDDTHPNLMNFIGGGAK